MRDIYTRLAEIDDLSDIVIATLVSTSGSTPAKAGSSALFNRHGLLSGTIGGGILEGRVSVLAKEFAGSGRSGIFDFEFDKDISHKDEAICGGRATVLIDSNLQGQRELFHRIRKLLLDNIPVYVASTGLKGSDASISVKRTLYLEGDPEMPVEGITRELILLEKILPLKRLIIAGAGHIGKVLCHLAGMLDFHVTVVDDRPEFANRENLPDADEIVVGDIGKEMSRLPVDRNTYIVIVTRGHNDDSNALRACINSPAAYTGMIGSRTKVEKMRKNFIGNGWATDEQWASLYTPVGIEIGSRTVEEIAVSIAAQLVLVRSKGD